MDSDTFFFLIGMFVFVMWVLPIVVAQNMGGEKNRRDGWAWGFLLGWIGVGLIAVLPKKPLLKCPSCSYTNPTAWACCAGCGKKNPSLCPSCKRENPTDARFCFSCGNDFKKPPPVETSEY